MTLLRDVRVGVHMAKMAFLSSGVPLAGFRIGFSTVMLSRSLLLLAVTGVRGVLSELLPCRTGDSGAASEIVDCSNVDSSFGCLSSSETTADIQLESWISGESTMDTTEVSIFVTSCSE